MAGVGFGSVWCYTYLVPGARVIDKEFYEELRKVFARHPGSFGKVAKEIGCAPQTAQRAWYHGWPQKGLQPLSEVVREDQVAARALAAQRRTDALEAKRESQVKLEEQAALDAARSREQEGQIAKTARATALMACTAAANLLQKGHKIAGAISEAQLARMNIAARMRALEQMARFAESAARLADHSIKLERVILGEPVSVTEHRHAHVHVEKGEMAATISRANAALERARAAGIVDAEVVGDEHPIPDES